jgi:hypothetical protein
MCLLILHHRVIPGYPIVVAANRDEARQRPSDPPALWPEGFLAPRDRRAGGTWIGINRQGIFAGITNRSAEDRDPARPSRGLLVTGALAAPSARAAVSRVERAGFSEPQNPFNMLIADERDAFILCGGDAVATRALGPGTHVLTNEHELGELDLGDLAPPTGLPSVLEMLATTCRDHGSHGYAVCKHGERYGTVSSMLIARGADSSHPDHVAYAEGLPCQTPYIDLRDEVRALRK